MNYTITEKEFLAVVHAINKFRHYITGYETFIHTDHSAIRYPMKNLLLIVELQDSPYFDRNSILLCWIDQGNKIQ